MTSFKDMLCKQLPIDKKMEKEDDLKEPLITVDEHIEERIHYDYKKEIFMSNVSEELLEVIIHLEDDYPEMKQVYVREKGGLSLYTDLYSLLQSCIVMKDIDPSDENHCTSESDVEYMIMTGDE